MQMMLLSELRVHPKNIEVYGDENVDDLIKSIKEIGIQHALIVTTSGLIISGNRRYKAARLIGLVEVPVDIRVYKNELDEWEAILECNKQREKTKKQRGAEGGLYGYIREERKQRSLANLIQYRDDTDCQPVDSRGRTDQEIAEKVGLGSYETYRQVQYVLKVCKELPEEQARVLEVLLEKSTKTAYRIVKEGLVDRLIPDIIVKLQNEDVPAIRIYRKIKRAENAEELRKKLEVKEPENRINPEWEELEKKRPGEACAYDPTLVIDEVVLCPCGCGCGFYRALQTENDRWYLKDELNKLKEMREDAE